MGSTCAEHQSVMTTSDKLLQGLFLPEVVEMITVCASEETFETDGSWRSTVFLGRIKELYTNNVH
jgi:hypothetical protein